MSCGEGIRQRGRECNNPAPANGALGCPGQKEQSELCENEPCPGERMFSSLQVVLVATIVFYVLGESLEDWCILFSVE